MSLRLVPISLKAANEHVEKFHRHHPTTRGHKFSISAWNEKEIVGVAISGRPVARGLDNGLIAEVTRVCTDGSKNACSLLYSASARACEAMGYLKVVTYILSSESGTSLRATGWVCEGEAGGGSWSCASRPREDKAPLEKKTRYAKALYTIDQLKSALQAVWNADTSYLPKLWRPDVPSTGHCAVTALIVQDRFGGRIVSGSIDGSSHYWNLLTDGRTVDLTMDQFPKGTGRTTYSETDREYLLSYPETSRRYKLLNQRLTSLMGV